jgi:hypothetical protein
MSHLPTVIVIAAAAVANVGVRDVMDAMIIPASNALFDVGRQAPESDEEWVALRKQAVILVEAGRALMIDSRSRGVTWDNWSEALSAAGQSAINAIDNRDADGVLDAGNALIETCTDCHLQHLPSGN